MRSLDSASASLHPSHVGATERRVEAGYRGRRRRGACQRQCCRGGKVALAKGSFAQSSMLVVLPSHRSQGLGTIRDSLAREGGALSGRLPWLCIYACGMFPRDRSSATEAGGSDRSGVHMPLRPCRVSQGWAECRRVAFASDPSAQRRLYCGSRTLGEAAPELPVGQLHAKSTGSMLFEELGRLGKHRASRWGSLLSTACRFASVEPRGPLRGHEPFRKTTWYRV